MRTCIRLRIRLRIGVHEGSEGRALGQGHHPRLTLGPGAALALRVASDQGSGLARQMSTAESTSKCKAALDANPGEAGQSLRFHGGSFLRGCRPSWGPGRILLWNLIASPQAATAPVDGLSVGRQHKGLLNMHGLNGFRTGPQPPQPRLPRGLVGSDGNPGSGSESESESDT